MKKGSFSWTKTRIRIIFAPTIGKAAIAFQIAKAIMIASIISITICCAVGLARFGLTEKPTPGFNHCMTICCATLLVGVLIPLSIGVACQPRTVSANR